MRIDWIVAAVSFLMFLSWAFSYYNFSVRGGGPQETQAALRAADTIRAYMQAQTLSTPANITFGYSAPSSTVFARMNWTGDFVNSTRVVLSRMSNESLECMASGDFLYWTADLSAGNNAFFIEQADMDAALNCNASLAPPAGNQTTLWASEPGRAFSSQRNAEICAFMDSSFSAAKDEIGIPYDFRLEISDGGALYYCGLAQTPGGRDVFSFSYTGRLWEGGYANITVVLWQ